MSDPLKFMMGEFEAEFPSELKYADNHMWAEPKEDGLIRFGFTAYAVRLLQDVYFLDWLLEAPVNLEHKHEMGSIESKKAESALYSPVAGELIRFNEDLMADPSAINVDKYGAGWLFEIRSDGQPLLDAGEYVELLDSVWELTQRTIKGQLNS